MAKQTHGVLALDLGTSSVRAIVYDDRGRLIDPTVSDVPYKVDTAQPGQVSSDPDLLVRLTARAIDRSIKAATHANIVIDGVATSCYWHSLLGVDERARPTTEVLTWADTRSVEASAGLRKTVDEHRYHARTGCFFHASFWPAKLRWLRRTRPMAVRRTSRWVGLGEYLYDQLLGERRVSLSIASGTGLLDVHRCAWDRRALQLSGIREDQLSPLADWGDSANALRPAYARRWPSLHGIPWFLPLGDGAAANVGADCTRPQWMCATIGTSSALRVVVEKPDLAIPWGVFAYRLDRQHFVVGGALSEGGNVIRWFEDGVDIKHKKKVAAAAAAQAPDSSGLTVLPFWAGERSPNWRGDARAVIAGLSLATQSADLLRAAMESITYQFGHVYTAMRRTVARPKAVVATGGKLVHSPAWQQMLADTLDVRVVASPEAEASSRGVALLALHALGRRAGLWRATPKGRRTYRPRAGAHAIYKAARERQAHLYDLLFPPPGRPELHPPSGGKGSHSRTRDLRSPAARR